MTRRIDLLGLRFGEWEVLGHRSGHYWLCRCSCGKESEVVSVALRQGLSKSCGCKKGNHISQKKTTHGKTGSAEYHSWASMISRCENPQNNRFQHYGGRGIKVCKRWRTSFEAFLADVGVKPSPKHSIDRLNIDGDYTLGNVRWATAKEQANNKQTNVRLSYQGREMTLEQFSEVTGISYAAICRRRFRGWNVDKIAHTKEEPPKRKLTNEQLQEILLSHMSHSKLAVEYSVSKSLVRKIKSGIDGYREYHGGGQ